MLPSRRIFYNAKNSNGKITNCVRATATSSPSSQSGAHSSPPIGDSFMYIQTSSNNHGHERAFVSFEQTDIFQISNITFYYNRYPILTNDSKKSMGGFRIQLLLEDNTWITQYTIPKNSQYSNTSTDWTTINLDFTVENYGNNLVHDQIETFHADMCFSNIAITYSV